ncbi:hypothetical protein [Bariatricus sp. HCP28S3_D3]
MINKMFRIINVSAVQAQNMPNAPPCPSGNSGSYYKAVDELP